MRLTFQSNPGEWFFAFLMAASPIVGSFWVDPEITRWIVFGVGCATVVGVLLAAMRPVRISARR
jgi:uncharacterized membrane protein YccC